MLFLYGALVPFIVILSLKLRKLKFGQVLHLVNDNPNNSEPDPFYYKISNPVSTEDSRT